MEFIEVKDAFENNLKHISVSFPLHAITCVTGVSGCGKSSLVYDTVFAESQRIFLESIAGNMFGQKLMDKPKVANISNLRPALNIAQKYYNTNPRSTVGTITDISYYIRTIFALISNIEKNTTYTESSFSPNNPISCCRYCHGIGEEYVVSLEALIPNPYRTLKDGAITFFKGKNTSLEFKVLEAICKDYNIDINKRFCDLTKEEIYTLLYRNEEKQYTLRYRTSTGKSRQKTVKSKGIVNELNERLLDIDTPSTLISMSKFLKKQTCSHCNGTKLDDTVLKISVGDKNIAEVESMPLSNLINWISDVEIAYKDREYFYQIIELIKQIKKRILNLIELKIGYITLNRTVPSLSDGELQRIRIAMQLNCSLKEILYILDEPCKGLHIKDVDVIINATKKLVDNGNTLIVIDHNPYYISHSDKVIELGPLGGPKGGYVISEYKPQNNYVYDLQFKKRIECKSKIKIDNINFHNIINQSAEIPIGLITCITGVSGSGKSSLIKVILESLSSEKDYHCIISEGRDLIKNVEYVDQKPIGKTPRSTVISYLGLYEIVRELFANTTTAIEMGLTASDFSMNIKGGRCEECQGTGRKKIELTYLPDTYITCPVCKGRRFNEKVLKIKYKNYSIDELLDSTIEETINVFSDNEAIFNKLECMIKIGLGYIKLGQMSMNLSGGEAQRIKLAKALGTHNKSQTLYILDEPTSGLAEKDIERLESILYDINSQNNTILIVEHNPQFVVKNADYIIDFGCHGGISGGKIIAQGEAKTVFNTEGTSWNFLINNMK